MTEDWRDRLKHLETPVDPTKRVAGGKSNTDEAAEETHFYRESETDLVPPAHTPGPTSNMSFKASRGGKPEAKRPTREREFEAPSTAPGAFDLGVLDNRVQQEPISTEELLKQLEKFSADQLLAAHKKQKMMVFMSIGAVGLLLVVTVATMPLNMPEVTKWCTRACCLAVPLSLIFGIREGIKILMRKQPLKAQKLHKLTSWGEPRDIAFSYIDTADYLNAEKVLEKACKTMNAKQAKQYISAYGLLGVIHAYTGRTDAAEKIIRQAQDLSEANYKARQTDSNSVLLAMSLSYTGELYQLKGMYEDSHRMYLRALQLICTQLNPQGDAIVSALANVGYLKNLMGHYADALPLLLRANEIADKLPQARESVKAFVYSNLGTASRGMGNLAESEDYFHQAIACASGPLGQRELGRIYYDLARLYVTDSQHDRGLEFYQKSVAAYETWQPVASPEFLRVLQDYAYYLRSIEHNEEADAAKKRSLQMQQNLRDINGLHQGEVKKVSASIVQSVAATQKPSRFPIFWAIFFLWQCNSVWVSGLRVAPYREWMLLITAAAILALKLKTKYGPPSRNELSQGAAMAVLSMIPFARSVLPEVSQLSKKGIGIFMVVVLGAFGLAKTIGVAPNTVPNGLFPVEYEKLGEKLITSESYGLAKESLDKAYQSGDDSIRKSVERIKNCKLPRIVQPAEAIRVNMDALALQKESKNSEEALKKWNECMVQYPDFEQPAVHVAEEYLKKEKKTKEAEDLLNKVLSANPNYYNALLAMGQVKSAEGDSHAGLEYARKALTLAVGTDDPAAKLSEDMLDKMNSNLEKVEKEAAARKAARKALLKAGSAVEGASKEQPSVHDQSKDQPSVDDQSKDSTSKESSIKESSIKESAVKKSAITESAAKESAATK